MAGAIVAGLLAVAWNAPARSDEAGTRTVRVVVHVNFADAARQGHGLKNVENMMKAAGEAGVPIEVEVVCHADGITLVEKARTAHASAVAALVKKGVRFAACENTMRQRSIRRDDLLPGLTTVPSGAFEVVRRQHEGYSYFKP
jgi:intracellular sulfur oxidation DsrE/DsrF family protein